MAESILAPTESRRSRGSSTHLREHRADAPVDQPTRSRVVVEGLTAWFGATEAVKNVSMTLLDRRVTAIIGPSGCGKSTFLRCLNRMHETVGTASVRGRVLLDAHDIYGPKTNPAAVRKHVGMLREQCKDETIGMVIDILKGEDALAFPRASLTEGE